MLCMKMSNDKEEIVMQENSKGRKKKKDCSCSFLTGTSANLINYSEPSST